jgi:DNA-binding NtrC family response regulator
MSELKVSKDGKISFKINLSKNLFKIGRSLTSDLTLDDLEVSREHAEIIYRNENYYLKDKSLAGTKVNNQFVDEIILEDGAKIEIGRWQIEFNAYAKEDEAYLDDVKTTITQYQKKSETKIVGINQDQNSFLTEKIILLVKAPDKNTRRFILNEKSLTIGSSSEADIMVEDDYVSSLHARLTATNNGIEIKDLGSTNGVWINENKVGEISLTPPQIISLGQTKLSLFSEQENEEIEPLNVDQFCGLVGKSESMRKVYKQIKRVAPTLHTVLIQADTGCGKELVAKAIHDLSPNKSGPYYILNCGAISPNLIESELFGHEKGAFTGAINRHVGVFEKAYNGTVFLDEIGELPLDLQPKLLRVLENRTIRRVGSSEEIPVRARIIAATHRDLKSWVEKGKFRMDLYYRLCVLPIFISSLKERAEDIPLIATHLVNQMSPTPKKISSNTIDKLMQYPWPGNVRELKNVLLRAMVYSDQDLLTPDDIEFFADESESINNENLAGMEKEKIIEVLGKTKGNKSKAARQLGIARSTLFKKMKEYDIPL